MILKRIVIIGCPGSGKSTFARKLQKTLGLPLYYLDMLNWNADGTTVPREVFRQRLDEVIERDEWIIDGNYGSTMERRIKACDTIIFLDFSLEVCLDGIRTRKGKIRPDMPWVEEPDREDEAFLAFIQNYASESRPKVMELLDKYRNKNIVIFKTCAEADAYCGDLNKESRK